MLLGAIGIWGALGDLIDEHLNRLTKDQVTIAFGLSLFVLGNLRENKNL